MNSATDVLGNGYAGGTHSIAASHFCSTKNLQFHSLGGAVAVYCLSLRFLTRLREGFSAISGSGTDTGIAEPATDTPATASRRANQTVQPRYIVVRNA